MKRWNHIKGDLAENVKIDAFLGEVIAVCKKHGFSIGHEDANGAFVVHKYDPAYAAWLIQAMDETDFPEGDSK